MPKLRGDKKTKISPDEINFRINAVQQGDNTWSYIDYNDEDVAMDEWEDDEDILEEDDFPGNVYSALFFDGHMVYYDPETQAYIRLERGEVIPPVPDEYLIAHGQQDNLFDDDEEGG